MTRRLLFAVLFAAGLLGAYLLGLTTRAGLGLTQSAEVVAAIEHAAAATGVSPRFLYCLAAGESGYRPWVTGDHGTSHGLMQFKWGTWNAYAPRYGFAGYSPYHAWASAHVAAGMIAQGGRRHWTAARWCGSEWW